MYMAIVKYIALPIGAHKISLTLSLVIEVPAPSQSEKWVVLYMCIRGIDCVSTIDQLDFRTVPTVWYFLFLYLVFVYR